VSAPVRPAGRGAAQPADPGHRLLARLPEARRALLRPVRDGEPAPRGPMLATLSSRRDFDAAWLFERKLDGVRAIAVYDDAGPHLLSRTGRTTDTTYPEVIAALAEQGAPGLTLDGEIVALDRAGRTDFSLLQQRMGLTDPRAVRASRVAVTYYVFDLLTLDGWDLTRLPLRTRKALLRAAVDFTGPLRFTPHRNHDDAHPAAEQLAQACGRGWEGLIAKRANAPYQARRSGDWLKLKCASGQEFVVGGFTEPAGARVGFGALLLGYHDASGALRFAGKVGTGWSDRQLRALRERLDGLERPRTPFAAGSPRERGAHWVEPALVAQIGFSEWTRDGLLRHPRFLGLRDDKAPEEVVRERPA
jgi:bifunctional non-homologous end joining protein LigD